MVGDSHRGLPPPDPRRRAPYGRGYRFDDVEATGGSRPRTLRAE